MHLTTAIQKLPFRVQRQFHRLDDEQKDTLRKAFLRHVRNCQKADCNIDPQWLPEAIADVRKGWLEI
jgi:phage terminase Nu1 subunit (DNA packaging protein)